MADSGVFIEERRIIFKGLIDFLILPTAYELSIKTQPTPRVSNIQVLIPMGAVNTITDFIGGADNQMLRILGDGVVIIANNFRIKTNTGANKTLLVNKVYTFHCINNVWYESA